jgi:hypothetical protein
MSNEIDTLIRETCKKITEEQDPRQLQLLITELNDLFQKKDLPPVSQTAT